MLSLRPATFGPLTVYSLSAYTLRQAFFQREQLRAERHVRHALVRTMKAAAERQAAAGLPYM